VTPVRSKPKPKPAAKKTSRSRKTAAKTKVRAKANGRPARKSAVTKAVVAKPRDDGTPAGETPFEKFVLDFVKASGGSIETLGERDYRATFDAKLAKKLRRRSARLIFDLDRAMLPRGGVFAAPGSRFGLALIAAARGEGQVSRSRLPADPAVDTKEIAAKGFTLHGAEAQSPKLGKMRWVCQVIYHLTLTLRGGVAEQDLRAVLGDPRGPIFEYLESDDRRRWKIEPGFPEAPVWWGDSDVSREVPGEEAESMWNALFEWLNRVQEPRLDRWRRRCDEARDTDLERINSYYEMRLQEESERRRRRRDDLEDEDGASEAQLKFEWSRRVRSVRARWHAQASVRLWGIEELARPRLPVMWQLDTPDGPATLSAEIDLADGALTRLPCPVCGRLAGEFWWNGQLVCRRCRGQGPKKKAATKGTRSGKKAAAKARSGRGLRRTRRNT
jgi:hypothetical protein